MASRSLGTLSLDLVMQMGGFEQGMDKAQRATEKFSKGIKRQQDDLDRLIGKIDPVVGRLSELDRMEEKLRKHHKDGLLPKDDFDHYLKKVGELRDATGVTSDGFKKTGLSAKQLAFATRGLPAQFTDIAVSLQGGQKPLTVLMQQGGQLKDMFGGIGPAAKAMGGYIAGLINPYTVAAAAIGGLAIAAYQGAQEAGALRNAIILTGRSASELNQLQSMARTLSAEMKGVTVGEMSASLAEVAANGKIASQNIGAVSAAAQHMNLATGKAVAETVSEFEQLQKSPGKAISELDEKYHFLTASTYSQIAALERQGKQQEAADLATKSYAETIASRSKEVTDNLGWIEAGWKHVAGAARLAWDDMKNAGRGAVYTLQQQNEFDKQLIESYTKGQGGMTLDLALDAQKRIQQRNKEIAQNKEKAALDEKRQAGARAQILLEDAVTASLTKQQKKQLELDKLKENQGKAKAAGKGLSDTDYSAAQKAIEDKYKPTKEHAYHNEAGTSRLQSLRETEASLRAQLATASKLTSAEQDLARFNQQIADIKNKKQLTVEEKSLKANESQLRRQYEFNAALSVQVKRHEESIEFQKKALEIQDAMATALDNQKQLNEDQTLGFGSSDRARDHIKSLHDIDKEYAKYRQQTTKSIPQGQENSPVANDALAEVEKQKQARIDALKAGWDAEAQARGDWQNGMTQSWGNYLEKAQDVAASTKSAFDAAFGGMEDALVTFVKTGKLSFSSLVDSIIDGLARIAIQQTVLGLANMFGSALAGPSISSGGAGGAAAVTGNSDISNFVLHKATGGYISGPGTSTSDSIPAMLSDGEFIVNADAVAQPGVRDTLEALNARRRYSTGGYVSAGSTSPNPLQSFSPQSQQAPSFSINVEVTAQEGVSDQDAQRQGQQIAAGMMKKIAQDVVASETMRTNGVIFNALRQK